MRHRVKTTRLNRRPAHLDKMVRNLATSIVLHEKVKTTRAKAKVIRPVVERLIANAKKQDKVTAVRNLNSFLMDRNASKKVMEQLITRYKDRSSGFVRITPVGFRAGDAAPMVQIELV